MTRWPLNSHLCFSELRYRRAGKGERIRAGRAYVRDVAAQLWAELDGESARPQQIALDYDERVAR